MTIFRRFLALGLAAVPGLTLADTHCPLPQTAGFEATMSSYYACDAMALEGRLSPGEIVDCAETYLALKLTFVGGVTPEDFRQLSSAERHAVNAVAYERFQAWEACHSLRIADLR